MPTEESPVPISAFLGKLLSMVKDPTTDDLICWSKSGNSFIIKDPLEFTKQLLPKYYKHNNMASFVRQLNMYGFHKVISTSTGGLKSDSEEIEFLHPYFVESDPQLMEHIRRKMNNVKENNYHITSGSRGSNAFLCEETLNKVLCEMKNLQGKMEGYDTELCAVKSENEILWRELAMLRHKHVTQQHIINKLIRFLVSLANSSSGILKKRYLLPMIKDATTSKYAPDYQKDHNYPKSEQNVREKVRKRNRSPGPVIHEIYPSDILDNVDIIEAPISESSSPVEVESEFVQSPSSVVLGSPDVTSPRSMLSQVGNNGENLCAQNDDASNDSTESVYINADSPSRNIKVGAHFLIPQSSPSCQRAKTPLYQFPDNAAEYLADLVLETEEVNDEDNEYITINLGPDEVEQIVSSSSAVKKNTEMAVGRKKSKGRKRNTRTRVGSRGKYTKLRNNRKYNNSVEVKTDNMTGTTEYILNFPELDEINPLQPGTSTGQTTMKTTTQSAKLNDKTGCVKLRVVPNTTTRNTSLLTKKKMDTITSEPPSNVEPVGTPIDQATSSSAPVNSEEAVPVDTESAFFPEQQPIQEESMPLINDGNINNGNEISSNDLFAEISGVEPILSDVQTMDQNVLNNSLLQNIENDNNIPMVNMGYGVGDSNTDSLWKTGTNYLTLSQANVSTDAAAADKTTSTLLNSNQSNMKVACPDTMYNTGDKNNRNFSTDFSTHLDSVQSDLDKLIDMMKTEGLSFDPNTILNLFNEDPLDYNIPLQGGESNADKKQGTELVSLGNDLPPFEFIDVNDWNSSMAPSPEPMNLDSYSNLNTPQIEQSYLDYPSPKRIKKM